VIQIALLFLIALLDETPTQKDLVVDVVFAAGWMNLMIRQIA
jgi:hypothetical protein